MKGFTVDDLKYFTYEYEKACNLGKMYLLSKIHKRYSDSRETDHLFEPVECLLKRYPNFWIITLNQTCKMINHTLGILEIVDMWAIWANPKPKKQKETHSEKICYIFPKKVPPTFWGDCLPSRKIKKCSILYSDC